MGTLSMQVVMWVCEEMEERDWSEGEGTFKKFMKTIVHGCDIRRKEQAPESVENVALTAEQFHQRLYSRKQEA